MNNLKPIYLLLLLALTSFSITAQTVPNGGFEEGITGWGSAQPNDAAIEFDIRTNNSPEGNNHARIMVVSQGTNTPDNAAFRVGIRSAYIPVIGGETYRFSSQMRSPTEGKTFQYRILLDDGSNMGGHGNFAGERTALIGGWRLYEQEITIPTLTNNEVPVTHIRVIIGVGGELGEVRMDDFKITQIVIIDNDNDGFDSTIDCDDNNPNINPDATDILDNGIDEDCDGTDAQFIPNLGFENGSMNWGRVQPSDAALEFDIDNTDSPEGNLHAVVNVTSQGTLDPEQAAYRIGIRTTYLPIQAGQSYRFKIRLKSPVPNKTFQYRIFLDDGSNMGGHGVFEGKSITITSEWTVYEQDILIPERTNNDAPVTHIRVLLGVGGELGEIRLDDLVFTELATIDNDGDGFSAVEDCNDNDAAINPGVPEIADNEVDENCDGLVFYQDRDVDGFTADVDCDDNNPTINPAAIDILDNGIDEDCNGVDLSIFDNLVPNFGFEEGRTGWGRAQPNDSEIEFEVIDTSDAPEGSRHAIVTTLSQGAEDPEDAFFKIGIRTGYFPVRAGTLYNFKISLKSAIPNKSFQYRILLDDGSNMGGHGSLEGERFTVRTEWRQFEQQIMIPALTNNDVPVTHIRVILGTGGELGAISIDDLMIKIDDTVADRDNDGVTADMDCNDMNPNINPTATETLDNEIDEDCDGFALYSDKDGDGFTADLECDDNNPNINPEAEEIPNNDVDENCDGIALIIDEDNDGFNADEDCDDNNAAINPEATDIPNNGIDEDCDGNSLFIDNDNDRYHSGIDCDDNNPNINPEAPEIPNNDIDENCDGIVLYLDEDNDGFTADIDCDDNNAGINPGATDIPNNGIDEDCDGIALFIDNDNDRYHSGIDCDDNDPNVNPEAPEIANNDIDENCDGIILMIDEDNDGFNSSVDCDDNNAAINPNAAEIPNNGVDEDCDGIALIIDDDNDGFNSDEDCNDKDPTVRPNAMEIPNNDIDENCDGIVLAIDRDNDGYTSDVDCDDQDAAINPGAIEIRNNHEDENCDGVDETLFDDFPWLGASVVNRNNCRGIDVDIYQNSQGVYFVHVKSGVRHTLYTSAGSAICNTFPHTDCLGTVGLKAEHFVETWACPTNNTFADFPTTSKVDYNQEDLSEITVYPTLSHGQIKVSTDEKATVRVINLAGQVIRSFNHFGGVSIVDLADLQGGYYLIQVKAATQNKVFRIVLIR